jgi:hypothetical protein
MRCRMFNIIFCRRNAGTRTVGESEAVVGVTGVYCIDKQYTLCGTVSIMAQHGQAEQDGLHKILVVISSCTVILSGRMLDSWGHKNGAGKTPK